jgi:ATP-dependent helicase/nuclease subunit A
MDFLFITFTDEGKSSRRKSFTALINEGLNQELKGDEFRIEGDLSFLQKENNTYSNLTKSIKLEIPIIRNIETTESLIEKREFDTTNKKLVLTEIKDESKGEVISATRFSTFSTCPLKYNLLYNYKLGDLIQQSSKFRRAPKFSIEEDYNRNELSSYLFDDEARLAEFSKFKGQLIHYTLRKNLSRESVQSFLEEKLKNNFNEEIPETLKADIMNDLKLFYDSDEFGFINSFTNFKNEYEAYLKEGDFYLFGILDKLIIEDKKLIIVDYKTDFINPDEIEASSQKYLPQLKFYAYIISRLFNKKQKIEGRVIFIKFPDKPFIFNYDESSDQQIKSGIKSMINSIRKNNYSVNLSGCKDCIFADENLQCIKSRTTQKLN